MFARLDRYMLRSTLGLFAGLTGLAMGVLLIERLIRLTEVLSGSDEATLTAVRMIANLVPHYLEMALPAALLIAIIISVDRLSRSGEIVAMMATGVSLIRIARPYMMMAAVLALASVLISGFLQPITRYNYRQIAFELKQSSIVTAFKERKFVQFRDRVVWTDHVDSTGRKLGATFIIETAADGSRRFMTGQTGLLRDDGQGAWVITLSEGMIGQLPAAIGEAGEAGAGRQGDRLMVANVDWQMPVANEAFRSRGNDQRELTLSELISGSYRDRGHVIDPVSASADLHDRLSRSALLLALPLIGVALGLNIGRVARSGGVATGIFLLLVVQKLLEFGLLKAERGAIPAWAGLWPIVLVVALGSVILFRLAATGRQVLPTIHLPARLAGWLKARGDIAEDSDLAATADGPPATGPATADAATAVFDATTAAPDTATAAARAPGGSAP